MEKKLLVGIVNNRLNWKVLVLIIYLTEYVKWYNFFSDVIGVTDEIEYAQMSIAAKKP